MTISSTTNRVSYTGNGVTTAFAFGYKFLANADLKVYEDDVLKTITTHYTVAGAGNDSGGTVTFLSAPANGIEVVILRDPAITQGLDLVENDPLPAEDVENSLDKLTMICQRLADKIDRQVGLGDSVTSPIDVVLPLPSPRKAIIWNATEDGLINSTYDPDEQANLATAQAVAASASASSASAAQVAAEAAQAAAEAAAETIPAYDSLTGEALNYVRLNATEDKMEFRTPAEVLSDIGAQAYAASATQAEMEAGTEAALRSMSPLRVAQAIAALGGGGAGAFKNKIIGGDFTTNPWQRGTSFTSATSPANSDNTYLADRWYLLSDGNDIVDVTRSTDAPTGAVYSLAMDVETANKKFGIAHIIEQSNAAPLIGGTCSLSFKAKITGTSLTTIKAGVVAWSGTADTVTSDIISAWGADGVTPTLIANATFENTPADLNVTTSWAEYKIENISIDTASTKNLIVFIWCDNATTTIGDFLYVTQVQLESGSSATDFETRPYGIELALCQRYYYRVVQAANGQMLMPHCWAGTSTLAYATITFPTQMRTSPTAVEQSGTAADYRVVNANTATACSGVPTFNAATPYGASCQFPVASGLTAGQAGYVVGAAAGAAGYIGWSAEL